MTLSVSALLPTLKVLIIFLRRCTEDKMDFVLDALFKQSISFKGYKMSWNIYNIGFEQMFISLYCSDQMRKPLAHMISCSHELARAATMGKFSMDWQRGLRFGRWTTSHRLSAATSPQHLNPRTADCPTHTQVRKVQKFN